MSIYVVSIHLISEQEHMFSRMIDNKDKIRFIGVYIQYTYYLGRAIACILHNMNIQK